MSETPLQLLASSPLTSSTPTLYEEPDLYSKQNEIGNMRQEIASLYTAAQVIYQSLRVAKSQVHDVMSALLALRETMTVFPEDLDSPSPAPSAAYDHKEFLESDE
jgi:hypothetical protein